jgi:hypothetical protein
MAWRLRGAGDDMSRLGICLNGAEVILVDSTA